MAAEDYIDDYDFYDEMAWEHNNDEPRESMYPKDFPCKKCHFSEHFRCTRKRGTDRCPYASWFAEHAKEIRR